MRLKDYQEQFDIKDIKHKFFLSAAIAQNNGRGDLAQDFYNVSNFISNINAWISNNYITTNNDVNNSDYDMNIVDIFTQLSNIVFVEDLEQRALHVHHFLVTHLDDITRYVSDTEQAALIIISLSANNTSAVDVPTVSTLGAVSSVCSIS